MPATPPPVEQQRVVAATPFVVRRNLMVRLDELGLAVASGHTAGPLVVERFTLREEWADCRVVQVVDDTGPFSRVDWARPQACFGELRAVILPAAGGTGVTVSAIYAASYLDRYRNTPFEHPCLSTGRLEGILLDAAG
jgi:hypothetical protein